ncbi:hypothetical protein, partial [uncultured Pseudoflavonifractor sp.]
MKKREERGRTAETLEKRRNQRREMKSCWQNEVRIYSWYRGKGKENRVGLSNILDGELVRRGPVKRSHREVVRAAVMDS